MSIKSLYRGAKGSEIELFWGGFERVERFEEMFAIGLVCTGVFKVVYRLLANVIF